MRRGILASPIRVFHPSEIIDTDAVYLDGYPGNSDFFTDPAGTILATTSGVNTIGMVEDVSGYGYHMTRSNGINRPIFHKDVLGIKSIEIGRSYYGRPEPHKDLSVAITLSEAFTFFMVYGATNTVGAVAGLAFWKNPAGNHHMIAHLNQGGGAATPRFQSNVNDVGTLINAYLGPAPALFIGRRVGGGVTDTEVSVCSTPLTNFPVPYAPTEADQVTFSVGSPDDITDFFLSADGYERVVTPLVFFIKRALTDEEMTHMIRYIKSRFSVWTPPTFS